MMQLPKFSQSVRLPCCLHPATTVDLFNCHPGLIVVSIANMFDALSCRAVNLKSIRVHRTKNPPTLTRQLQRYVSETDDIESYSSQGQTKTEISLKFLSKHDGYAIACSTTPPVEKPHSRAVMRSSIIISSAPALLPILGFLRSIDLHQYLTETSSKSFEVPKHIRFMPLNFL